MYNFISNIYYNLIFSHKIRKEINIAFKKTKVISYVHYNIKDLSFIENILNDKARFIFDESNEKTKIILEIILKNLIFTFNHIPKAYYFTLKIVNAEKNYSSLECISKYNFYLKIQYSKDFELLSFYLISLKKINFYLDEIILKVKEKEPEVYNDFICNSNWKIKKIEQQKQLHSIKLLIPKEIKIEQFHNTLINTIPKKNEKKTINKSKKI